MEYSFVTVWYIEAPLEAVCELIYQSQNWPQWWRNVESVEEIAPGDARGIGSVRRYTWRGRLPYRLTFDIRVIHIAPLAAIEGIASGDVEGKGRWSFTADGGVTARGSAAGSANGEAAPARTRRAISVEDPARRTTMLLSAG